MNTNIAHSTHELDQARDVCAQARDAQTCMSRKLKVSIKGSKDATPQAKASVVLMCG